MTSIDSNEIADLRAAGCTWESIAEDLGIPRVQLYLWRKRNLFPDARRNYHKTAKSDIAARRLGFACATEAIRELRWSEMTVEQVAEKLGVHERTVRRHYPAEFAGTVFVKTSKYLRTRRRGQGAWGRTF